MQQLILASTSPYRLQLLRSAGISVRVEAPGVDERAVVMADPVALARELAHQKASAVAQRYQRGNDSQEREEQWVLGADQVAYDPNCPAEHFGKPIDAADHVQRLTSMIGRRHMLATGYVLIGPGVVAIEHEITALKFRDDIGSDEIAAYVASGEGSNCAGGYAADGRGAFLIEQIEGDWFNVVGLPLLKVLGLLRANGWRYR